MLLKVREARPGDVDFLVGAYEQAYRGGYSACFDRYGAIGPQEFWWVQSEKSVAVVEIDRAPAGMLVIGRDRNQLLVEELFLVGGGAARQPSRGDDSLIRRLYEHLLDPFKKARQDRILLRTTETNAVALSLAQRHEFTFVNALVVTVGAARRRMAVPGGYTIRRATPEDTRTIGRLSEDLLGVPMSAARRQKPKRELETRLFLAEHDRYVVGLAEAQIKDGIGWWTVGVRDTHRRKGLGAALADAALQFFASQRLKTVATYWALDAGAARLAQSLGCVTERTYLYLEKRI